MAVMLGLASFACGGPPARLAPPAPAADPRLLLGEAVARPRAEAAGAPVDCAIDVVNRSDQMLARAIVTCELLDVDGVPIGAGLSAVQNLASGQRQSTRSVIYGVRVFSGARPVLTQATFR